MNEQKKQNSNKIEKGLVSVIIPVFNRTNMLQEAIASVLAQSYRPIEVVIVDDGSTDDTPEFIHQLITDHSGIIRSVRQDNAGPGPARQEGMALAQGEFIQFLDSDDVLLPEKFTLQVASLRDHPECGISFGKTRAYWPDEPISDKPSRLTGRPLATLFPECLRGRPWHTVTPLYRRCVLDQVGPWAALRQFEDWEYDCRIGLTGVRLDFVNTFIAEQRHHRQDRLYDGWTNSDDSLTDAAIALQSIYHQAIVVPEHKQLPEFAEFSQTLRYWGRECAFRGLSESAAVLLRLANQSERSMVIRCALKFYRTLSLFLGWPRMERFARTMARVSHE